MSSIIWNEDSLKKVIKVGSGTNWEATGISIDTRTLKKGDIYIAFKGANFDGHDFLNEAYNKGAVLAIVNHKPKNSPSKLPLIIVEDQIEILGKMAAYKRDQFKGKVIGITGTVGKTTTKEAMYKILSDQGRCFATSGNFNSRIGMSLCLAAIDETFYDYGVFEIGMTLAGEIEFLSTIVRPDIAIITTITPVHMEFFNSLEGVASAKAEIFIGMQPEGRVLLNKDNEFYEFLMDKATQQGIQNIYSFGSNATCHFKLDKFIQTETGGEMYVEVDKTKPFKVIINHLSQELAINFLSILGVVNILGLDIEKAAKSFEQFYPVEGRGKIKNLSLGEKKITVLDDSYNASPASVAAAILALGTKRHSGRKVAIIGDMKELGPKTVEFHQGLKEVLIQNMIDKVITCGNFSESLYKVLPDTKKLGHFVNVDSLYEALYDLLEDNDLILIKGSKSVGLQRLVKYLEGSYVI